MGKLRFKRGYRDDLPVIKEGDTIYVTSSRDDDGYGSINIGKHEWVSKEYIDNKIGEIERLLEEL